ncbi:hypothetical protein ACUTAF_01930 [Pseudomonas sp. SP16.1]|uniref:hypothetical protein n=1 Tax=Pseudomonas sp. SP16.1 TaxID=3458854 RepID=UPI004045CF74
MSDWSKAKARQLIANQIAFEGAAQFPSAQTCEGMIEMAYALDLLNDSELNELNDQIANAVAARRKQLRADRNAALLGLEVSRA